MMMIVVKKNLQFICTLLYIYLYITILQVRVNSQQELQIYARINMVYFIDLISFYCCSSYFYFD